MRSNGTTEDHALARLSSARNLTLCAKKRYASCHFTSGCSAARFSALRSGRRGRRFKSAHPDHFLPSHLSLHAKFRRDESRSRRTLNSPLFTGVSRCRVLQPPPLTSGRLRHILRSFRAIPSLFSRSFSVPSGFAPSSPPAEGQGLTHTPFSFRRDIAGSSTVHCRKTKGVHQGCESISRIAASARSSPQFFLAVNPHHPCFLNVSGRYPLDVTKQGRPERRLSDGNESGPTGNDDPARAIMRTVNAACPRFSADACGACT